MIGRKPPAQADESEEKPKGFDDFAVRLGDTMRGERATMGKSLLDVQRELRIKAAYVAAIENCDPSAFDTPGFIAGYVRSYARYLGLDPDIAFDMFCAESGFSVAHGMSAEASVIKKARDSDRAVLSSGKHDPFSGSGTPFAPVSEGMLSQLEPRAIGSALILLALIAGIGYGGWSVLRQIQQVQVAPVEESPVVLSDLDPLDAARLSGAGADPAPAQPRGDRLGRLQRPQALDVPVLVARDAPISTLDPGSVGTFSPPSADVSPGSDSGRVSVADAAQRAVDQVAAAEAQPFTASPQPPVPQVLEANASVLKMVAVRTSWVQVKSPDGSVVYEATMEAGDHWEAPLTEQPPLLRTGESGAIYFEVAGKFYGPVGPSGAVTSNVPLSIAGLQETYPQVPSNSDDDLHRYAEAQGLTPPE